METAVLIFATLIGLIIGVIGLDLFLSGTMAAYFNDQIVIKDRTANILSGIILIYFSYKLFTY